MIELFQKIAAARGFSRFITFVILFAGLLVGVETYPEAKVHYGTLLRSLDAVILTIFVVEVVIKMGAEYPRPLNYFRDPWNVFDFAIVAVALMPLGDDNNVVTVLRLVRVLRVLKLVRALPKLQILVSALLKSIPSMGYVSLLLLLLFYLFAVTATFMFGANDPVHFENLQMSMLSLFRVVTLEDWTDVMYIQMYGCEGYGYSGKEELCTASNARPIFAAAFFVSFVLLGTMIILNLFVGVIMNGMDEAQKEQDLARELDEQPGSIAAELAMLSKHVASLQAQIERIQGKAKLTGK